MPASTFLTRVTLTNYKSIAHCDVCLRPLMFLVGPNGAGKSNFLDALRFVSDALNTTLDHAIRKRGGIREVLHRSGDTHPRFSIRLEFQLPTGESGYYTFRIRMRSDGDYIVQEEECQIDQNSDRAYSSQFHVVAGTVQSSEPVAPITRSDRLYLIAASGLPAFYSVYESLSRMAFYNLNPEKIRDFQTPGENDLLSHDGDNITSVLSRMSERTPDVMQRLKEYLAVVVPGIQDVKVNDFQVKEALTFTQQLSDTTPPLQFPAVSMSDGTLRALGILVALFQTGSGDNPLISLVGIEEPETALHPAAVAVLLDALEEASMTRQVLITSHSADLLDNKRIDPDALLAVVARNGATEIGPIDAASRSILRDHLFTAGELLRMNQFMPDYDPLSADTADQPLLPDEHAA